MKMMDDLMQADYGNVGKFEIGGHLFCDVVGLVPNKSAQKMGMSGRVFSMLKSLLILPLYLILPTCECLSLIRDLRRTVSQSLDMSV